MNKIPLMEKVPLNYHRLYLFFGENDFRGMICVDGTQEMYVGLSKDPGRQSGVFMDWEAVTVMKIRAELQGLALFPGIDQV